MNLIMGNMGNGVSQLLTPSATNAKTGGKAGAGEGATLPFSALLTQMAAPPVGKAVDLPAVATPVIATPEIPKFTLADLPLIDVSQPMVEDMVLPETQPQNADATPVVSPKITVPAKPSAMKGREAPKLAQAPAIPVPDADAVLEERSEVVAQSSTSDADASPDQPSDLGTPLPTVDGVVAEAHVPAEAVLLTLPVAPNIQPTIETETALKSPAKARDTKLGAQLQSSDASSPPVKQVMAPDIKQAAIPGAKQPPLPPGLVQMVLSEAIAQTEPKGAKKPAKPDESNMAAVMQRLTQPDARTVIRRTAVESIGPAESAIIPASDADAPSIVSSTSSTAPVSVISSSTAITQPTSGTPTVDLAASLGQQVIDMGSEGQWIDGLAREIATLSKSEGHGSFRLSPEHLGPMRVDIRPGEQGANVTLTVETKAAESMLMQDRATLKADAQLAAVKIGDVTVERVSHVQEPTRADTATGQGNGGHSQSQTASQGQSGNNSNNSALAQGQGQSAQGQSGQNGNHAGNRKVFSDPTVSSQAEPRDMDSRDTSDATHRARYA